MEKVKPMEPEEMRGNHKRPKLRRNNEEARRGQGTPLESNNMRTKENQKRPFTWQ